MLRTLEQERAAYAWKCIKEIKDANNPKVEKNYKSYVKKAASLIQTNGLGNTLAFYSSKDEEAYKRLYEHIREWFDKIVKNKSKSDILEWIIDKETSSTNVFYVTKEILKLLNWMKRFAEAELEGE